MIPLLTLAETRVLGVLVEKEKTVPDTYPLSLNALVSGCNQKNNREPVLALSDADVQAAVDHLMSLSLVIESSGSRVMRYSHNAARVLKVPSEAVALLATLWLRGPQTAAELRAGSDRLHRFADVGSVEGYLNELASRSHESGGPLVVLLPRRPGAREARWAHLQSGPIVEDAATPSSDRTSVEAEIQRLSDEVAALRKLVDRLARAQGIDPS